MIDDDEFSANLFKQLLELWVNPELGRRKAAGLLDDSFRLYAAQVVMHVERPNEVRINQEVRALMRARATRGISKGEWVTSRDFSEIIDLALPDDEPDSAHITAILHNGKWFIKFDFRYNSGRIRHTAAAAREFLDSAKSALEKGHLHSSVDCLFSAVELLGKAFLLALPDDMVVKSKTHSFIASRLNFGSKHGIHYGRYAGLVNRLSELRPAARYLKHPLELTQNEMEEMIATAESMFAEVSAQVRRTVLT